MAHSSDKAFSMYSHACPYSLRRKLLIPAAAVVIVLTIIGGCAYHRDFSADYAGPSPLPASIQKTYAYTPYAGPYETQPIETNSRYEVQKISFETAQGPLNQPHRITMEYYKQDPAGKAPVIVVLPILGGRYSITRTFAVHFAEAGYAALLVHRQKSYKKNLGIKNVDQTLKQIVIDHKLVLDWVEKQPELDAERIGLFGVSMGSIKASLLTALDERVSAAVLGLVAGDIPHILTYSSEPGIKKKRNAYMEEHQITREELYQELKARVACDPMNYAEFMDAANIMMILGRFDTVMSYQKGRQLWQKVGQPELITILSGHITAYPMIPYIKEMATAFYEQRFGGVNQGRCQN